MATTVTGELYYDLDGQLAEIKRQLRQKNGYGFDPEKLKDHLQLAIEGKFSAVGINNILRLISNGESLIIPALDGQRNIFNHGKKVFPSGIHYDLKNWNLNKPGKATGETPVCVHELTVNADFNKMFKSLTSDLDKMCFSQDQIVLFCERYFSWLSKNWTFFLFSDGEGKEKKYFVADVDAPSDGLYAYVCHFENDFLWSAGWCPRVVVPQF